MAVTSLVIVSLAFASPPQESAKAKAIADDLKRFEGTWKFEKAEFDGAEIPLESLKDIRLILKGDHFEVTGSQEGVMKGTFKIDPLATPKTLDVTVTEGPGKDQTTKAIYKLDGDTYTACVAGEGKDRPTEFSSKPGSRSSRALRSEGSPADARRE
jgi:uncharacterized protein (TIGR03067 family)